MHVAGEETEEGQSAQGKSNHTVSGLGLGSRSLRVCWLLGIIIRPHKRVQLKHILSIRRIERSPCCVHNRGLCLARRQWNVRLNYENITLSRSCLCASAMCTPRLLVYHICMLPNSICVFPAGWANHWQLLSGCVTNFRPTKFARFRQTPEFPQSEACGTWQRGAHVIYCRSLIMFPTRLAIQLAPFLGSVTGEMGSGFRRMHWFWFGHLVH